MSLSASVENLTSQSDNQVRALFMPWILLEPDYVFIKKIKDMFVLLDCEAAVIRIFFRCGTPSDSFDFL